MTSARAEWKQSLQIHGFALQPNVLTRGEIHSIVACIEGEGVRRSRAGIRHALSLPTIAKIANDPRLLRLAREVLGPDASPYRATLFDKSARKNWLVVWHQDTALPLAERFCVYGWGPWSSKDGILYAHAPAHALCQLLALRIHLDDSTTQNGPLRVLPTTHTLGVLSDEQISQFAIQRAPLELTVRAGGVIGMRPLLVHASSKSNCEKPRRVLHLEYSAVQKFDGLSLVCAC